jgi:hypothetical protein
MLGVVESVSTGIVAGRNNEARRRLERLDADAAKLVSEIHRNERIRDKIAASKRKGVVCEQPLSD